MQFTTATTALEWYINHRQGGEGHISGAERSQHSYDAVMVAAADIEAMLKTQPVIMQQALFSKLLADSTDRVKQFPGRIYRDALNRFQDALNDTGYIKNNPEFIQQAA